VPGRIAQWSGRSFVDSLLYLLVPALVIRETGLLQGFGSVGSEFADILSEISGVFVRARRGGKSVLPMT